MQKALLFKHAWRHQGAVPHLHARLMFKYACCRLRHASATSKLAKLLALEAIAGESRQSVKHSEQLRIYQTAL